MMEGESTKKTGQADMVADGAGGTTAASGLAEPSPNNNGWSVVWKVRGLREKWKELEYRRKVWRTVWLGASFWGLGFSVGVRGPSFLDVQIITNTDVEQAAFFFSTHSVGYLVGSLACGFIYDLLNKSLLLLVCVAGLGASNLVLPWCSLYWLMIAINFVLGFFGGGIDTVGNAELLRVWGKDGEMAMQFIHFAFAIGGLVGPLVAEPFLTPMLEDEGGNLTTLTTPNTLGTSSISDLVTVSSSMATMSGNFSNDATTSIVNLLNSTITSGVDMTSANSTLAPLPVGTNVHYAFMICGCLNLLVTLPLLHQLFSDRSHKRRQDAKDEAVAFNKQPLPTPLFLVVMVMLCTFYLLNCSVEDTFASFLATFVVTQLQWSKSKGAGVTGVYWAMFSVFRFLGIVLVHLLGSVKLLALSCVTLFFTLISLLLFASHSLSWGIWLATAVFGSAMAAVFPTGLTWMEEELVRVTGRVASFILIFSSVGMIFSPIVIGFLMQEVSPMWFVYYLMLGTALMTAVFLSLLVLSRFYLNRHRLVPASASAVTDITIDVAAPTLPSSAPEA